MLSALEQKKQKVCVVGLGYVGLPIALEFARKYAVVGFDINEDRVALMRKRIDPSQELDEKAFDGCDIEYTAAMEEIKESSFYVVAVPTPIDEHKNPDLRPLLGACKTVGSVLSKGDYVVFESTVYPGCTEEDCIPILEEESGLEYIKDFKVGYSPERINPGDKEHTLTKITKVVSGCDEQSLQIIADVYGSIITAGIHKAQSIKVAEAAKIIENTQRDLNIALMNELSQIFKKMDINTYEVLEAAGTKWNFLKFFPGLVGGHCIGVDPYYLTYKSNEIGYHSKVILAGRAINDSMGENIAQEVIQHLNSNCIALSEARVLVMGMTFKENVADIRNSKVIGVIDFLKKNNLSVDVMDPYADAIEVKGEYQLDLIKKSTGKYDAIILAVNHKEYEELSVDYFNEILSTSGLLYDVKGIMRNKRSLLTVKYLSL